MTVEQELEALKDKVIVEESPLQSVSNPNDKLFKLDQQTVEVDINVSPDPDKEKLVSHRLRRPTPEMLVAREREATYEIREEAEGITRHFHDETANARLYVKIRSEVKGYRLPNEPKEAAKEWRECTEELLQFIPKAHLSKAVDGMYISSARLAMAEDDDEDGFVLGNDALIPLELIIGYKENPIAVIPVTFAPPDERERLKYDEKSSRSVQVKGSRKLRQKLITDLQVTIDFFKRYVQDVSGATVNGKTFAEVKDNAIAKSQWLDAVDPMYMRLLVNAAMSKFNASLRD